MKPRVLMLSPEAPYPLRSGGAYRTASLLNYFARFAEIDLIQISEAGRPALLPPGLIRSQIVIPLPVHGRGLIERYLRNARRAFERVPPLVDRLGGLGAQIREAVRGERYAVGIVEHSWCAPYVADLSDVCGITVLDLHNVESVLHDRCAHASRGLVAMGHRRFAAASRTLEAKFYPRFSTVLAASGGDRVTVSEIAPAARVSVYPNSLPYVERPDVPAQSAVIFSGNFEYHPNIDALNFMKESVWPRIRARHPDLRLKLVGKGSESVQGPGIEGTGPVENALAEIAGGAVVVAPLRVGSGTRIKILEAWAAARPVIATPLAAEGLEAVDGKEILLARDAGEFADRVDAVLADTELGKRIGDGGRLKFESSYTWDAAWRALALNPQLTLTEQLNRYTE